MSLRLVATPLDAAVELPVPRDGGLAPGLLDAFVPAPGTAPALARLREPGALVVTTGQQPGLFTGPLYTVHKALSAAALARALERRWQRPVVPVFWLAGDDHDYAEASQAWWLTADGELAGGALPPRPADAPSTPLYREPLGAGIGPLLDDIAGALSSLEFGTATVDWLRRHFRPDATVGGSYAGALAELLAPAGIVCLDSTHPCVKHAAAPYFLHALDEHRDLEAALVTRARALRAAGHDPDVAVGDGATLVMLEGALGRDRLVADGDGFVTRRSGERFELAELRRLAARSPDRLSANVLLRPVVESALLPTVAYVAGPGELRYLELTPPVYERLGVPRQQPVPRWSGLLVERRVDRVLEKFGVTLDDLLAPAGRVESRLVLGMLPDDATGALARLRAAVDTQHAALARAAADIDPTLVQFVERLRGQGLGNAARLEKKLVQHLKRRREIELGRLRKARAAVFPNDKRQERVLTIAPFLARHGPGLLPLLLDACERWYAAALEYTLEGHAGRA